MLRKCFLPFNSSISFTNIVAALCERELVIQCGVRLVHKLRKEGDEEERKVIEVGLIGVPNAGKSELANHLVGQKITAVSSKQNTTTRSHLGAFESGNTQVVLYDLPGIVRLRDVKFKGQLRRVESAWTTATHCDIIAFIVDAAFMVKSLIQVPETVKIMPVFELAEHLRDGISQDLQTHRKKSPAVVLALNKLDLVREQERYKLEYLEELFQERCVFRQTFHLSALHGHGVPLLKSYFISQAQKGQWILPAGARTDKSAGELAVELVREKLYRRLNKELPYSLEPELLDEDLTETGTVLIDVVVRVASESVKKIVVGRGGTIIEHYVISRTRKELESALKRRVLLRVNVKVKR